MTDWIVFAVLAPILWGVSNVIDVGVRRHYVKSDTAMMWFLAITRLPIIIVFLILFGIEVPSYKDVIFMLVGGIIWISPFFMYYKAIEFEEPSRVVLLMQMTPIFIMAIAFFMLGEVLTLRSEEHTSELQSQFHLV